jgi:hypothetical protein
LTSEEVLDRFYLNIEKLDNLISFRFYQKTPYVKFKETMKEKYNICGEFIDKKIIETEYSAEKNAVRFKLEVKYKNKNTIEQIVLIKEFENSSFEVYEYNIKLDE